MKYIDLTLKRIMIIIIIICINIVSIYMYIRVDLTKTGAYTLSGATVRTISELDDVVRVRLFFSKNLPPQLNSLMTYTKDLLTEYQTLSRGKIQYEFVNPDTEDELKIEARKAKIPSLSIEVYEKDKVELRDVFLGMSIVYGTKNEIIPIIQNTEGLEFLITNTLKNMIGKRHRLIAYFQPLTEFERVNFEEQQLPMPNNISVFNKMISSSAIFDRTDLVIPLPEHTDLLIVNAVKDSLSDIQLFNIDQFIMKGKPVLIFQDRYVADINAPLAKSFDNNLLEMLRHHSIFVKPALVMDASCFQLTRNRNQGGTMVPVSFDYPFFPFIKNISDSLIVHKNVPYLYSYYSSEVFLFNKNKNIKEISLLKTSDKSFEQSGTPVENGFELNTHYSQYLDMDFEKVFNHKSKKIANIYYGDFESYYKDIIEDSSKFRKNTNNGILFVAGTTSLLNNELLQNSPTNAAFILNVIDFLTNESDFILMRNRNIAYSPIKDMNNKEKQFIKYINLIIPSIFVLCYGFIFHLLMQIHKDKIKRIVNKRQK
ncbi:MAG: GldG family protein [Candidatus Cloacimonetes bacterium]|nr:GldG family protein [Candidatus Cloacimonadota bacterium]MDD4155643.1 GldG family protein [Candidatus Cloacimonadota bacterium]